MGNVFITSADAPLPSFSKNSQCHYELSLCFGLLFCYLFYYYFNKFTCGTIKVLSYESLLWYLIDRLFIENHKTSKFLIEGITYLS